ncbi:biopolymer transport protein ExbB [Fibrobacter sp. UWH5]|uniref:MotA/TolQ/ExbB proton channel family protein n=1 Tax=Fibrobacter sp. UWH5 TaxID=1896211 RepID=UPI00091F6992|nr:MotA/TolQ/ExbB proton channel family protein [Fibrobacter sp. UWH5]SHL18735.1 biopolymer transport protein ExbB [Fibrobacter sp. UWH5]
MNNSWYIFIEALQSTYGAGGVVMLPILLCGAIGFYFLYSAWIRIGRDIFRKDVHKVVDRLRKDLHESVSGRGLTARRHLKKRGGIVARELHLALKVAIDTPADCQDYMQVRMIKTVRYMQQGTHIVSVMAAAAPLLGLLGTVTGMVSTFEVITLYGNQNPVLMADGISEALISTQSGLLIAFPLTLLKQRLDERIEYLTQQLELGATIIENWTSGRE